MYVEAVHSEESQTLEHILARFNADAGYSEGMCWEEGLQASGIPRDDRKFIKVFCSSTASRHKVLSWLVWGMPFVLSEIEPRNTGNYFLGWMLLS